MGGNEKMKVILKFKDGMSVNTDIHTSTGDVDFFNVLLEGVRNNSVIEIDGTNGERVIRTYAELDSIEIKVHE